MNKDKSNFSKAVTRGAIGVALAAGTVAVGAALANRKTRQAIGRGASKGLERVKSMASEMIDNVEETLPEVTPHQVRLPRKRAAYKKTKSRPK